MQETFLTQCVNGHEVHQMCIKKDCIHPSGICLNNHCICENIRNSCNQYASVENVLTILRDYNRNFQKQSYKLIIGAIDKIIKSLDILNNEYLNSIDKQENRLIGKRKQLYQLMKNGPANNIKPELVANILQGIDQKENKYQTTERLEEISNKVLKQHDELLESIRRWIKQQTKTKFVFDHKLNNNNRVLIFNEESNVKYVESIPLAINHVISVISPSIFEAKGVKLTLQCIKSVYGTNSFGLVSKEMILKAKFNWTKNKEGVIMVQGNGKILNPSNPDQHDKQSDYRFDKGDVVELQYCQGSQMLKIRNLTKQVSVCIEKISDQKKDLHYFVHTWTSGDQWGILNSS